MCTMVFLTLVTEREACLGSQFGRFSCHRGEDIVTVLASPVVVGAWELSFLSW